MGTWLAVRLVFGDGEATATHDVMMKILDPQLGEISETHTNLTLGAPNHDGPAPST